MPAGRKPLKLHQIGSFNSHPNRSRGMLPFGETEDIHVSIIASDGTTAWAK
jgi:hypothetical protein